MSSKKASIVFIDDNPSWYSEDFIWHRIASWACKIYNFSDSYCLIGRSKKNGVYNGLSEDFKAFLKKETVDIIACDVNFWDWEHDQGIHAKMIKEIKEFNKTVRIISYSGNLGKQIACSIKDHQTWKVVEEKITQALKSLLCNCSAFEPRETILEKINELLSIPNFSIEIEREMALEYPDHCYEFHDGTKAQGTVISEYIRTGDSRGIEFVRHASEFGISNISAILN